MGDDKIAQNLLILAYDKPVTVTELAKAIGIAAAYIEPVIDKLVSGELLKRVGTRSIPILLFTPPMTVQSVSLLKNSLRISSTETCGKLWTRVWRNFTAAISTNGRQNPNGRSLTASGLSVL